MKITRISGKPLSGKCIAMTAIASDLQRCGKAVLQCTGGPTGSTTAGILQMCSKPVPFAVFLHDYDPERVDLDALNAEPSLDNVLCYVEIDETRLLEVACCPKCGHEFTSGAEDVDPNDPLDDILPISVPISFANDVAQSNGIVTLVPIELLIAADSEGGEHD